MFNLSLLFRSLFIAERWIRRHDNSQSESNSQCFKIGCLLNEHPTRIHTRNEPQYYCPSQNHIKCPGNIHLLLSPVPSVQYMKKVQVLFLALHKSTIRVQLNHFFQVLPDIWEALQRLLKVVPGQREALAVGQCLHRGQMFAFGQHARLCCTHGGNHKSMVNEQANPNDGDEIGQLILN